MLQDFRLAARQLIRAPAFAVVVVLTLAVGIGANTAIFSVVDAVLLRPLAYREAARVVTVFGQTREDDEVSPVPADFMALAARSREFERVAGFREWEFNVRDGERTEQVSGAVFSPEFFPLLGVAPLMGRTLVPGAAGRLPRGQFLISEQYWRTRLHGAPDVLGHTMVIDGKPAVIVGVMPARFTLPGGAAFWVPSPFAVPPHPLRPDEDPTAVRSSNYFTTIARLKDGVTLEAARQEVYEILRAQATAAGDQTPVTGAFLEPIRDREVGDSKVALLILFGAASVLLLIACANLGNLFLADAANRQREWTVRVALGAGRRRLIRERLALSLLLSLIGGIAALLVAMWGVPLLIAIAPDEIAPLIDPVPDLRVLGFTAVVSVLAGIVFGVVPAFFQGRLELAAGLRSGGRGAGDSRLRRRVRGGLVMSEVALAFVLAIGAALLGKTFIRVREMPVGFNAERLSAVGLLLPAATYPTAESRAVLASRVMAEVARVPGVSAVSVVSRLALAPGASTRSIETEGANGAAGLGLDPDYLTAGPDYLHSMGIPLESGREFTSADRGDGPKVVLVNSVMARKVWPGRSALGQRVKIDGDSTWREVVGVMADVRQRGFDQAPRPTMVVPFAQDPWNRFSVVVRSREGGADGLAGISAAIQSLDRDLAVRPPRPMSEVMSLAVADRRFSLLLIGIFAGAALLLAMLGVYGVIAYTVAQRTREVGIRMAVGARPGDVIAMILREGGLLAAGGLGAGIVASLLAAPLLRRLLYGIAPTDQVTFVEVGAVLAAVALVASYLPARRATRVDPAIVLRSE